MAYLLSALVPFLGFLIGGLMLLAGGEENRHTGGACIAIALLPTIFALSIISIVTSPEGVSPPGGTPETSPQGPLDKMYVSTGWNDVLCTFSAQTSNLSWDDIQVRLSGDHNSTTWQPQTDQLLGNGPVTARLPEAAFGNMMVWCNITDMGGDGFLGSGDSVYLSTLLDNTFSSSVQYTVSIVLLPQDQVLYQQSFFGGHFGIVL